MMLCIHIATHVRQHNGHCNRLILCMIDIFTLLLWLLSPLFASKNIDADEPSCVIKVFAYDN